MRWPAWPPKETTVDPSAAIMAALSRAPRLMTAKELSEATGYSRPEVERVLLDLALAGRAVRQVEWVEARIVARWSAQS